jgi:hypothetical protein
MSAQPSTATTARQGAVVEVELVAIPRKVVIEGRTMDDKRAAYGFVGAWVVYLILAIVVAAISKAPYTFNDGNMRISDHYLPEVLACCNSHAGAGVDCFLARVTEQENNGGRRELLIPDDMPEQERLEVHRRLAATSAVPRNIWEGFGNAPVIPVVLLFSALVVCVGFIKAMEKCSKQILFLTFLLKIVALVYLGIETGSWPCYALAGIVAVYVFFAKKKIEEAAIVIECSAHMLLQLPSLMCTVYSWLICSAVLIIIYIAVNGATGYMQEVSYKAPTEQDPIAGCGIRASAAATPIMIICNIIWQWGWQYMNMVQIFFVAGTIGTYHFDKAAAVATLPLKLIKIGVTSSLGTLAKLAAVMTAVETFKKYSKCSCRNLFCPPMMGIMNPLFFIALVARWFCLAFLRMLTKNALIFHVFTGEAFWPSVKRTKGLLKKAGMSNLVLETTATSCFWFLGYGIAVAFAFACWAWMGKEYNMDLLKGGECFWDIIKYVLIIFLLILMTMPIMGILCIVIIAMMLGDATPLEIIPWCCAVFTGAIVNLFFSQGTQALLYASNTMFVAIAVDKANNFTPEGMEDNPLYRQTQKDILEAIVVDDDGNEIGKNSAAASLPPPAVTVTAEPVQMAGP